MALKSLDISCYSTDYPCGHSRGEDTFIYRRGECEPAYDFKHRLSLTSDTEEFKVNFSIGCLGTLQS